MNDRCIFSGNVNNFKLFRVESQYNSHFCKLLRSSCNFVQSEELYIVKYRRVSSKKSLTVLLLAYSGRSFHLYE